MINYWYSFLLFGSLAAASLPAALPSPNQASPASAFAFAIARQGITTTPAFISAAAGHAFAPMIATNIPCPLAGSEFPLDFGLDLPARRFGFVMQSQSISSSAWSNALFKKAYLLNIRNALDNNYIVLVKGGWSGANSSLWLPVCMLSNTTVFGSYNSGVLPQRSPPEKVCFLNLTNSSLPPNQFRRQVLARAAARIRNDSNPDTILSGSEALHYIADLCHRDPFCTLNASHGERCLLAVITQWKQAADYGCTYLDYCLTFFSGDARVHLVNAREYLLNYLLQLSMLSEQLSEQEYIPEAQLNADAGLRACASILWQCGNELAMAVSGQSLPEPLYMPKRYYSPRQTRLLARSIPLFSELEDGNNTFVSSALMAAQVMGKVLQPILLKGFAAIPFKLALNTNSFQIFSDAPGAVDVKNTLISAIGFSPVYFSAGQSPAPQVIDFFRSVIADSINRGFPVLCRLSPDDTDWCLLLGYAQQGNVFMYRTPAETTLAYRVSYEVPTQLLLFGNTVPVRSYQDNIYQTLQLLTNMYMNAGSEACLGGIPLLHYLKSQCKMYDELIILPPLEFASANQTVFKQLLIKHRDACHLIQLVAQKLPKLHMPFTHMYENYSSQILLIKEGFKSQYIIGVENGIISPPEIQPTALGQEARLLEELQRLESEILFYARDALKTLNSMRSPQKQQ